MLPGEEKFLAALFWQGVRDIAPSLFAGAACVMERFHQELTQKNQLSKVASEPAQEVLTSSTPTRSEKVPHT